MGKKKMESDFNLVIIVSILMCPNSQDSSECIECISKKEKKKKDLSYISGHKAQKKD